MGSIIIGSGSASSREKGIISGVQSQVNNFLTTVNPTNIVLGNTHYVTEFSHTFGRDSNLTTPFEKYNEHLQNEGNSRSEINKIFENLGKRGDGEGWSDNYWRTDEWNYDIVGNYWSDMGMNQAQHDFMNWLSQEVRSSGADRGL